MLLILFDITNTFKCNSFYLADSTVDPDDIENILTEYCGLWRGVGLKLGLKSVVLNNI